MVVAFVLVFAVNVPFSIIDRPIIISRLGNISFNIRSIFTIPLTDSNRDTPTNRPMILPVLSLSFMSPIRLGMMIKRVHQPVNRRFMFMMFKAFNIMIIPIRTRARPHTRLFFCIFHTPFFHYITVFVYLFDYLLFVNDIFCFDNFGYLPPIGSVLKCKFFVNFCFFSCILRRMCAIMCLVRSL